MHRSHSAEGLAELTAPVHWRQEGTGAWAKAPHGGCMLCQGCLPLRSCQNACRADTSSPLMLVLVAGVAGGVGLEWPSFTKIACL